MTTNTHPHIDTYKHIHTLTPSDSQTHTHTHTHSHTQTIKYTHFMTSCVFAYVKELEHSHISYINKYIHTTSWPDHRYGYNSWRSLLVENTMIQLLRLICVLCYPYSTQRLCVLKADKISDAHSSLSVSRSPLISIRSSIWFSCIAIYGLSPTIHICLMVFIAFT